MTYEAYDDPSLAFETLQLHAGYDPAEHNRSKAVPIYQTAAFQLGDLERCERLFSGEEQGHTYVRLSNPTNGVLERRIATLEGGAAAVTTSSGMNAISNTLMNLARAGDEIAAVKTLYGGSTWLLDRVLPDFGITTNWVEDPDDPEAYRAAITPRTKAVFVESLGNPRLNIVDIEAIAAIAHEAGIPLVVDNTFATPYLLRPLDFGADIVCHSATKYISGHGTVIGGLVVEGGGFDWTRGKFPRIEAFMAENAELADQEQFRRTAFTSRLREQGLAELGGHMSPMTAFLILQGIETLSLRMRQHVSNAIAVARFLEPHPSVVEVSYPSLPSSPQHELAQKYFPRGSGAMISLRVRGGLEGARRVLERTRIFDFMANVGDVKSMIAHPATSSHYGLSQDDQEQAGVFADTIRLSIGTEDPDDLVADLRQALAD